MPQNLAEQKKSLINNAKRINNIMSRLFNENGCIEPTLLIQRKNYANIMMNFSNCFTKDQAKHVVWISHFLGALLDDIEILAFMGSGWRMDVPDHLQDHQSVTDFHRKIVSEYGSIKNSPYAVESVVCSIDDGTHFVKLSRDVVKNDKDETILLEPTLSEACVQPSETLAGTGQYNAMLFIGKDLGKQLKQNMIKNPELQGMSPQQALRCGIEAIAKKVELPDMMVAYHQSISLYETIVKNSPTKDALSSFDSARDTLH